MSKKIIFSGIGLLILVGVVVFVFSNSNVSGFETLKNYEGDMSIYKSGSCGCCGVYVNYFQRKGNNDVKIFKIESLSGVKAKYGIPSALESCHTTIIGDYFIEGHIPLEAIEKLMQEKPDIKGIAMPGMPSGSPGMPGEKKGDFVIYAVNHDGSYKEWMRI